MSRIRYLLDENVAPLFRIELVRREPAVVVWKIGDPGLPPRGTLDPEILCWCEREEYCLVTRNRKSMPPHLDAHLATGRHIPGIFTIRDQAALKQVLAALLLIWEAANPDEYQDQIVFIPF